jgi:mannose-6-phosphate isomerase-like protein (cupin superfamily)
VKLAKVSFRSRWKVFPGIRRSQAAQMVIPPGDSEGGPENCHPKSDQWLYVVEGRGVAIFRQRRVRLAAGHLLLIEKGELHEIRNTGKTPLKTLNFYASPAYRAGA